MFATICNMYCIIQCKIQMICLINLLQCVWYLQGILAWLQCKINYSYDTIPFGLCFTSVKIIDVEFLINIKDVYITIKFFSVFVFFN